MSHTVPGPRDKALPSALAYYGGVQQINICLCFTNAHTPANIHLATHQLETPSCKPVRLPSKNKTLGPILGNHRSPSPLSCISEHSGRCLHVPLTHCGPLREFSVVVQVVDCTTLRYHSHNCNPLQYSCLEKSHRQGSLGGYSPWSRKNRT